MSPSRRCSTSAVVAGGRRPSRWPLAMAETPWYRRRPDRLGRRFARGGARLRAARRPRAASSDLAPDAQGTFTLENPVGIGLQSLLAIVLSMPLLLRERVLLHVCIARFDAAGDTTLEASLGMLPGCARLVGMPLDDVLTMQGQLDQPLGPCDVADDRAPEARRRDPRRPACGCAAGRRTRSRPPQCPASTFSAIPPSASTWPSRVISHSSRGRVPDGP